MVVSLRDLVPRQRVRTMAPSEPGHAESDQNPVVEVQFARAPVIFLRGEVDLSNVAVLDELLLDLSKTDSSVIIDMADTTFIDGSVLRALALAIPRFPNGLVVRSAPEAVAKVFRMVEMDYLLS